MLATCPVVGFDGHIVKFLIADGSLRQLFKVGTGHAGKFERSLGAVLGPEFVLVIDGEEPLEGPREGRCRGGHLTQPLGQRATLVLLGAALSLLASLPEQAAGPSVAVAAMGRTASGRFMLFPKEKYVVLGKLSRDSDGRSRGGVTQGESGRTVFAGGRSSKCVEGAFVIIRSPARVVTGLFTFMSALLVVALLAVFGPRLSELYKQAVYWFSGLS